MDILTIIFIAVALAMDACAVSIANGVIIKKQHHKHALRFALSFGFFQMLMPVIGWLFGSSIYEFIAAFGHWIVFLILLIIGVKMIYEAFKIRTYEESSLDVSVMVLLGLAVATSIDALAVGLSFAFLNVSVMLPAVIIGAVTFVMSYAGFLIGNKFGHIFENKMEIAAGVVLILIGTKVLITHLFFM